MSKQKVMSPGVGLEEKPLLIKALSYFFNPITRRLKEKINSKIWSHHSDKRILDIDWKKVGFDRVALVSLLISKYKEPNYLEIGCKTNRLFDAIFCNNKVGVDPYMGEGNVKKTSNEFFKTNEQKE